VKQFGDLTVSLVVFCVAVLARCALAAPSCSVVSVVNAKYGSLDAPMRKSCV